MVGTAANDHPDCFHRADVEEAARRLAAIVRAERPDVIVSDDENGTYGHPDHIKAHHVTVRAVALAGDPTADVPGAPHVVPRRYVHAFSRGRLETAHAALLAAGLPSPFGEEDEPEPFGVDDAVITTRVDVSAHVATKLAAMRAHASQIGADSFFMNVPEQLVGAFLGIEEFVLEDGDASCVADDVLIAP